MTDKQLTEYRSALPQTAEALKEQRKRVNEILRSVMQRGVHYDVIKPLKRNEEPKPGDYSLLQPGAEVLLQTFHLGIRPRVENLSEGHEVHYRVYSEGFYLPTLNSIGEGVGECSSLEEKYAWRAAVCDEEFNHTPTHRRRVKFKTRWNNGRPSGHSVIQQVRQNPQDQANTILKMATKRANVQLVRTALSVSDIFAEPGETAPPPQPESPPAQAAHSGQAASYEEAMARHARPRQNAPQAAADGPPDTVQPNQIRILQNSLTSIGVSEEALLHQFQIDAIESLPFAQINDALEWIRSQVNKGGDQDG